MTRPAEAQHGVLVLSCQDAAGIVHAVSGLLVDERCTIVESHQFDSLTSGMFYMRVEFRHVDGVPLDFARLCAAFEPVAQRFGMRWRMADAAERQRVLVMVSQYAHCLHDLLFRNSVGELNLDVVAVVSNHPDLAGIADFYGVPFHHIPVTRETKPEAEAALLDIVRKEQVQLVILARYMQILSNGLCEALEGRAINIHHSMLPSFKGARPYHQAHARGVKFIGATAHYVTADLDEGPIIEQEMIRVDHSLGPEQLAARGREAETRALARAVRWHTENRVVIQGGRTVVFE
ncbi:formyltetrahydrofolate deformylase [Blastococcus sp. BMG 814]|uniref:Formyltetrahydrofolate deformylase n=1 Tax=Blastococcus carthaginiensis TaxID=3050034 RepID=A0ABT9I8Q2_9ACTN|nr:formyltetrahydrofolate deformylase [Blastococcus carthaginiensis]MDP5181955.1 formyltetrahydrofolate deformylase [Blastococcus carthaginiensis]